MAKDDLVYVGHMVDVARQIDAKAAGLDRSGFNADENLRLAVTHLIQTIGEAARLVSEDSNRLILTSLGARSPACGIGSSMITCTSTSTLSGESFRATLLR